MSFSDYSNVRPAAQLTPRNTPEQVHGARAATANYVRRRAGGDTVALRELIEMLGLGRSTAEITAEAAALAEEKTS